MSQNICFNFYRLYRLINWVCEHTVCVRTVETSRHPITILLVVPSFSHPNSNKSIDRNRWIKFISFVRSFVSVFPQRSFTTRTELVRLTLYEENLLVSPLQPTIVTDRAFDKNSWKFIVHIMILAWEAKGKLLFWSITFGMSTERFVIDQFSFGAQTREVALLINRLKRSSWKSNRKFFVLSQDSWRSSKWRKPCGAKV